MVVGEMYFHTYVIQDTRGIRLTVKTSTFTSEGVTQDKVNIAIKNFLSLYLLSLCLLHWAFFSLEHCLRVQKWRIRTEYTEKKDM